MASIRTYRYVLPNIKGDGWAEIMVCSSGMFAAVSDFGNYAFAWRHWGEGDFRPWLANLERDPHYLMSKLHGRPKEYDGDATKATIKRHILESRRRRDMDREETRREWDLLLMQSVESREDFVRWYDNTGIDDAHEFAVYVYPSDLRAFCEKIMPRLAEMIRAEIKAEKEAA